MTTATLAEMVGAPVRIGDKSYPQLTVAQAAELQQRWAEEDRKALVRRLNDAGFSDPQQRFDMLSEFDRAVTTPQWLFDQLRTVRSADVLRLAGAPEMKLVDGIFAAMRLCGIDVPERDPSENGESPDPK